MIASYRQNAVLGIGVIAVACALGCESTLDESSDESGTRTLAKQEEELVTPFALARRLGDEHVTAVAVDASTDTIAVSFKSSQLFIFTRSLFGFRMAQFPLESPATALALDGNTLVAGEARARGGSGVVEIFERRVGGFFPSQSLARNTVGRDAPLFGNSIALRGDTLIASEPGVTDHTGRVYAFVRSAGRFPDLPTLTFEAVAEPNPCFTMPADEFFGMSVALMKRASQPGSDLLLIGKPGSGQVCTQKPDSLPGRVYVYERSAGVFSTTPTRSIVPPSPLVSGQFGSSIAASEGVIVVAQRGRVDAFLAASATPNTPTFSTTLPVVDFELPRVAFDGDILAIANGTQVYVYEHVLGGGFVPVTQLTAAGAIATDQQLSVSVSGRPLSPPGLLRLLSESVVVGVPAATGERSGAFVYGALAIEPPR